jgi:hypothetical protein
MYGDAGKMVTTTTLLKVNNIRVYGFNIETYDVFTLANNNTTSVRSVLCNLFGLPLMDATIIA